MCFSFSANYFFQDPFTSRAGSHFDISISTSINISIRKIRKMCEPGLHKHKHKKMEKVPSLCLRFICAYVTPVHTYLSYSSFSYSYVYACAYAYVEVWTSPKGNSVRGWKTVKIPWLRTHKESRAQAHRTRNPPVGGCYFRSPSTGDIYCIDWETTQHSHAICR